MRKIITSNIYPPIPVRDFDWMAYFDGDDEFGPRGYGPTRSRGHPGSDRQLRRRGDRLMSLAFQITATLLIIAVYVACLIEALRRS